MVMDTVAETVSDAVSSAFRPLYNSQCLLLLSFPLLLL